MVYNKKLVKGGSKQKYFTLNIVKSENNKNAL